MKTFIIVSALLAVVSASVTRSPITRFSDFLPESRIIGGYLANLGQFPYQVALQISTPQGSLFCGGSIIDAEWILTAAHCSYGAHKVVVIAGSLSLDPLDESAQSRNAIQIINHPHFHPINFKNDIALIKLDSPLEFDQYVLSIGIAGPSEINNTYDHQIVVASGWGKTSDYSYVQNELRFVDLYVENLETCKKYYNPGLVTDSKVCVNTDYGTRTPCQGDSGGPLVLQSSGRLIGCTSFGSVTGCQSGSPSVFTRVAYYYDWIQYNTGLVLN
ncbi:hypothetical protein ACFFRR_011134 [Megaselia abdita]